MMGAARKMATVVVFGLLITTVSAGRVSMLSSPTSAEHLGRSSLAKVTTSSSRPTESTVRIDSVIGCTPKEVARELVINCREPVNAPMPIEACCAVAVGTVGRPSCYCLVKEEAAFGMSPLFNISNMAQLLARCGASIYLNKALDNPCDRSYDEKETAECTSPQMTPKTDGCKTAKVSGYVAWILAAVFGGFLAWMVCCQPAPAAQVVYMPEIQLVRPRGNQDEDQGPRGSDAGAGTSGSDSSNADSEDGEDAVSHTSQDLILEGKRNRNANPRFVGGPWVKK
ncbi:hypothetical protein VPH35_121048 [Triticum aestivum]